ncbi:MAG: protein with oligosaccharyl transferase domain [Bacteroidetes bacterium]|nr:protein with oligosaccharyl transferase domain [Bacteroidota bacterium]
MQGSVNSFLVNKYLPGIFILILNLIVRIPYLLFQDISHDEPFTIYHAQFDLASIVEQLKNYNNPPLFEIFLHFWMKLFGLSDVTVRVLPLLFSSLSSVALFYFGRKHFSNLIGWVSALLLSFSSLSIYYSHDCRVYSLFLLLTILSVHHFLLMLENTLLMHKGFWIICSSLLIYAHYFGFFVLFIQAIYILLFNRKQIYTFLIGSMGILVLYLPHLLVLWQRFSHSAKNGTWLEAPAGIESLYNMLWSFCNQPLPTVICMVLVLTTILCFLSIKKRKPFPSKIILLIIWFLLPFFGMFLLSYKIPMYIDRYLIFILPAWYLLLALSITFLFKNPKVLYSFIALLIISFAVSMQLKPKVRRDVAAAVEYVKLHKELHTIVLVHDFDFIPTFAYHYNKSYFTSVEDQQEYYSMCKKLEADKILSVQKAEELKETYSHVPVIYLDANPHSPNLILDSLQKNHVLKEKKFFENGYYVYLFDQKK